MEALIQTMFAKGSLFLLSVAVLCILAGVYLLIRGIRWLKQDIRKVK